MPLHGVDPFEQTIGQFLGGPVAPEGRSDGLELCDHLPEGVRVERDHRCVGQPQLVERPLDLPAGDRAHPAESG